MIGDLGEAPAPCAWLGDLRSSRRNIRAQDSLNKHVVSPDRGLRCDSGFPSLFEQVEGDAGAANEAAVRAQRIRPGGVGYLRLVTLIHADLTVDTATRRGPTQCQLRRRDFGSAKPTR